MNLIALCNLSTQLSWTGLFFSWALLESEFRIKIKKNLFCTTIVVGYNLKQLQFNSLLPGILLSSRSSPVSTPLEPCRVAPYVSLPSSIRISGSSAVQTMNTNPIGSVSGNSHFSRQPPPGFAGFDPALLSVAAHQYAAAMSSAAAVSARSGNSSASTPLFPLVPHHPLNLAALAAHSKNSSIADLRLKAKKHAEALFGGERTAEY